MFDWLIVTGSQAEPGNRYLEALPRFWKAGKLEAEPPDLRYQAEPGNEYNEYIEETAVPCPYRD